MRKATRLVKSKVDVTSASLSIASVNIVSGMSGVGRHRGLEINLKMGMSPQLAHAAHDVHGAGFYRFSPFFRYLCWFALHLLARRCDGGLQWVAFCNCVL